VKVHRFVEPTDFIYIAAASRRYGGIFGAQILIAYQTKALIRAMPREFNATVKSSCAPKQAGQHQSQQLQPARDRLSASDTVLCPNKHTFQKWGK
jgi:hypothetical protein